MTDLTAKLDAETLKEWASGTTWEGETFGPPSSMDPSSAAIILARALLSAKAELELFKSAKKAAIARAIGKQEMAESSLKLANERAERLEGALRDCLTVIERSDGRPGDREWREEAVRRAHAALAGLPVGQKPMTCVHGRSGLCPHCLGVSVKTNG